MNESGRVGLSTLATGVPGLDTVLGGGLPEYSFNLIAGGPGGGKTTLAHQIMFANAALERRAIYFTVLGEPPLKMWRYQQLMSFFDPKKVDDIIHFVNLSEEVLEKDLSKVLESIVREVEQTSPGIVVVDSFRTVIRAMTSSETGEAELQDFVQRLAVYLSGWEATTFLIGEYSESEIRDNPVFTVADGILWLYQSIERNSVVRKLQVMKMRGQASIPGLHTFRITSDGIQVFPRMIKRLDVPTRGVPRRRVSTGVAGLDEMLGGGVRAGDSILVSGPAGSGKSVLGAQFIAEGVRQGEPGVIVVFEEHPQEYLDRAGSLGFGLEKMVGEGKLKVIYLRPLDLSVDETLQEIQDSVGAVQAKRVVIDSLSGFELALAPTFRQDFRESLYRLVGALTGTGVTVLMTVEQTESSTELRFSAHEVSFLSDEIIMQRYVEVDSQLLKVMAVVKTRSSDHSKYIRTYEVTPDGLVVGDALKGYRGIITGVPEYQGSGAAAYPGLTAQEIVVLQVLGGLQEGPIETIAKSTGLQRSRLARALARLVELDYAVQAVKEGKTIYRPARARAL